MFVKALKSKIHRATVTAVKLDYPGSVAIDSTLLEAAGILPYEAVLMANITNGARAETYAVSAAAGSGEVSVLGAAARLFNPGDIVIIMSFGFYTPAEAQNLKPKVVVADEKNRVKKFYRKSGYMIPELFEVPFIGVTVKSYGLMMVIGFLAAVWLMRRLCRRLGENPDDITNVALYALVLGVVGARLLYVVHRFSEFRARPISIFAVWEGGLEFLGGLVFAVIFVVVYLRLRRHCIRRYLDILAVGLMLGLSFGRIGCFLNGCCFGRPSDVPWAVRYPYGSFSYVSQVRPNPVRGRVQPYLELPSEYFGYISTDGKTWIPADEANKYSANLKPLELLDAVQRYEVTEGHYRALAVHPAQLYSSVNAFLLCWVLYLFWRKFAGTWPGSSIGLTFVLYGVTRFFIEFLRDDNPFEYGWWTIRNGWTVSQNLGLYIAASGLIMMIVFRIAAKKQRNSAPQKAKKK